MKCGNDPSVEISEADKTAVERFGAWLRDPTTHCIICLLPAEQATMKVWKNHKTRGRVWLCSSHLAAVEK